MREIFNCPRRRIDNEIARLADSVSALKIHCSLLKEGTVYDDGVWLLCSVLCDDFVCVC